MLKMDDKRRAALIRALENNDYEAIGDAGILVGKERFEIGGNYRVLHNGVLIEQGHNLMPSAARSYILKAAFAGYAQTSSWYVMPFINAVDPTAALTAANFDATLDEFTNYTESTRPAWTQGAEASQEIGNTASLARITCATGGGTINGVALTSVATKGSSSGLVAAAFRFTAARTLLEGDTLDFEYVVGAEEA